MGRGTSSVDLLKMGFACMSSLLQCMLLQKITTHHMQSSSQRAGWCLILLLCAADLPGLSHALFDKVYASLDSRHSLIPHLCLCTLQLAEICGASAAWHSVWRLICRESQSHCCNKRTQLMEYVGLCAILEGCKSWPACLKHCFFENALGVGVVNYT